MEMGLCNFYRKDVDGAEELWYITVAIEIEGESISKTV